MQNDIINPDLNECRDNLHRRRVIYFCFRKNAHIMRFTVYFRISLNLLLAN